VLANSVVMRQATAVRQNLFASFALNFLERVLRILQASEIEPEIEIDASTPVTNKKAHLAM
jgi:hypothetical protein